MAKDEHDTRTLDLFEKAEPPMPDLFEHAGIPLADHRECRRPDRTDGTAT